ncbi:MAG: hypothetical protein A2265_03505 [Bacteroidetes bacterium RIFOXYA12_FULL_33_9]|nr:MAG: hypothetical protein A2265_03505 [Bacteroidetes bacterium RIFOXYA12_FULL_33_9]
MMPAMAQQDAQYSFFMFNNLAFNPGFAGSNDAICASVINRQQYMGFEGYPSTTVFNIDAPISAINSGVGLTINSDKVGNEKSMNLLLSYAYRMNLGDGQLGMGLNLGIMNKSLSGTWVSPEDLGTGTGTSDPSIPSGDVSHTALDLSLGVFYRLDNFYVGLSSTHLNEAKLDYAAGDDSKLKRHYYLAAGYFYKLPNPIFELRPSILIKSDGATSQIDLNASLLYNKMFWGGVSYRAGDAIVAMAGVELRNGIKFGYAFDFVTNKIGTYNRASHEFILGYCFNVSMNKSRGSYKSVRIL